MRIAKREDTLMGEMTIERAIQITEGLIPKFKALVGTCEEPVLNRDNRDIAEALAVMTGFCRYVMDYVGAVAS